MEETSLEIVETSGQCYPVASTDSTPENNFKVAIGKIPVALLTSEFSEEGMYERIGVYL